VVVSDASGGRGEYRFDNQGGRVLQINALQTGYLQAMSSDVAAGLHGYHLNRNHRSPGTHPVILRRFFASRSMAHAPRAQAWNDASLGAEDGRPLSRWYAGERRCHSGSAPSRASSLRSALSAPLDSAAPEWPEG
jgi:hypothetical protein